MNNLIFDYFNSQFPFNREGLSEFVHAFEERVCKKGTALFSAGHLVGKLQFLESGVVREFYARDNRQMNINFYVKPQFITDFHAVVNHQTSKKSLETLSDVVIWEISVKTFHDYLHRYECGRHFVDQILKRVIDQREEEEFNHFCMTPDELYLDLIKRHPEWLQQVPLYHIAGYLRMTPETLSRIRSRV